MNAPLSVLVLAKAPVPGSVKTRLAAAIGDTAAAEVAAAALLDTAQACVEAVGAQHCWLALEGDLADAVAASDLAAAFAGWHVRPQAPGTLGERIAEACAAVSSPLVQIGMDTPQVTAGLLRGADDALRAAPAALGPALDGGWWALALRDGRQATAIREVPMSESTTGALTRQALERAGLGVAELPTLRDIDHLADLRAVAADHPACRTARLAARLTTDVGP